MNFKQLYENANKGLYESEIEKDIENNIFFKDAMASMKEKYSFNEKTCEKIYMRACCEMICRDKIDVVKRIEEHSEFAAKILNLN